MSVRRDYFRGDYCYELFIPLTKSVLMQSWALQIQQGNQRTVEEAMSYTICLLHSSQVLLPTGFHHHILQWFIQVMPSKGTQTIWKAGEWNEELESNVWSECSPENSAKHDNKGQSRNSAHKFVCSWLSDFTAPDFTVLSEVAAVTVPHRETTETFYKLSQIVCVRADSSDTRQLFIMACLQENVSVGMKRVKAKAFIQDPSIQCCSRKMQRDMSMWATFFMP